MSFRLNTDRRKASVTDLLLAVQNPADLIMALVKPSAGYEKTEKGDKVSKVGFFPGLTTFSTPPNASTVPALYNPKEANTKAQGSGRLSVSLPAPSQTLNDTPLHLEHRTKVRVCGIASIDVIQ